MNIRVCNAIAWPFTAISTDSRATRIAKAICRIPLFPFALLLGLWLRYQFTKYAKEAFAD